MFSLRLALFLLVSALPASAQVTNFLNLCTEPALRSAAGIGGVFQLDCGTNLSTITLTQPIIVTRDFTLVSTQQVIITGQGQTRLFVVQPGVRFTLKNILLFSGRQTETNLNSGGIPDTAGAGIYNNGGIVTVLDGRFDSHAVVGVTGLAGASGSGDDGEPGGDAAGAAIFNNGGQLYISNTVFIANSVTPGPGGAGAPGRTGGNGGQGGSGAGAAIYSAGGSVFVQASTFTNNTAFGAPGGAGGAATSFLGFTGQPGQAGDAVGAAITAENAELIVNASTFATNTATAANGLNGNAGLRNQPGERGLNGGDAAGAAIFATGRLWATNSTFVSNAAIAGNGGNGGASGTQGFGADGGNGGNGGTASGGAIDASAGARIVNCTFSGNAVTAGGAGAGGAASGVGHIGDAGDPGAALGGAVYAGAGTAEIANTILAFSEQTVAGNIADLGGNMATDRNSLLTAPTSYRLMNPGLLPLATNGGPTATMALATNSMALDRGLAAYCPPVDQRGTNRITCDIGAYELVVAQTNIPLPQIPTNVLSSFSFTRNATNQLMTLQWPAGYTNLYLQMATNLLMTNTPWRTIETATTTNNNLHTLTINAAASNRPRAFFRLIGITNLAITNANGTNVVIPPFPFPVQ